MRADDFRLTGRDDVGDENEPEARRDAERQLRAIRRNAETNRATLRVQERCRENKCERDHDTVAGDREPEKVLRGAYLDRPLLDELRQIRRRRLFQEELAGFRMRAEQDDDERDRLRDGEQRITEAADKATTRAGP